MSGKETRCDRLQFVMEKIVKYVVYGILIFSLFAAIICFAVFTQKYQNIFSYREFVWMIPGFGLLCVISKIAEWFQKKTESILILSMLCIEILIAAMMIYTYDTQPCSDYKEIWKAANEMANGTFVGGISPNHYMYYYNWQLGIAAFESLLIRLGVSFSGLKWINAALLMMIQLFEYRLVKRKFGKVPAIYAYTASVLFMPWGLTIPQFTNHHIGLVFLMVSLDLIDRHTIPTAFTSGVLLAVTNVLRPLGIIVILSVICLTIYKVTVYRKIKSLFILAAMLLSYVVTIGIFDAVFIACGYTDSEISQARMPYFKFQKGLYGYNDFYSDLEALDFDYDVYNAAMKTELISTISEEPFQTVVFVANKMTRYLGLFDYLFEMTYNHDMDFCYQYPVKALYCISWFQYLGLIVLAIRGYKKYTAAYPVDIYQVFFIGNTLVYLLIEAFSSYRFESYIILIMIASLGSAERRSHLE